MAELNTTPLPPAAETEEQKKARLASGSKALRYSPSKAEKGLPTSQAYVDKMQELAEDPTYAAKQASPEDRKSLQNILDAAQSQFEDAQNRAEWQDVAQTLGKALVQFGAATSGGSSRDMSNISQPTVDYGARINAAQQTMAGRQKTALSKFELDKQARDEETNQRSSEYKNIADALEAGRKTASAREGDQASLDRAIKMEQERRKNEPAPKKDIRPLEIKLNDIDKQEKKLDEQKQAYIELMNNQEIMGDLSTKSASKLQEKYGALASKAGVVLADLAKDLEATDKDNWASGFVGKTEDPKARKEILDKGLIQRVNLLDQIKKNKEQVLGSILGEEGSAPAPQPATPATPAPSSTSSEVTEEMVKKFAANNKMPENQARGILMDRAAKKAAKAANSKGK